MSRSCGRQVALLKGEPAGYNERARPGLQGCLVVRVVGQRQERGQTFPALGVQLSLSLQNGKSPAPKSKTPLGGVVSNGPIERRPQVVAFEVAPFQPADCLLGQEIVTAFLGKDQAIGGMSPARESFVRTRRKAFQRVVANRLQHHEPHLAAWRLTLLNQALTYEGLRSRRERRPQDSSFALQTASAASSVQPPTNTARRRDSFCSSSVNRPKLQSTVARSVC